MRRTPLKASAPADRRGEPAYREWHAPVFGCCCVCGAGPMRLERHHVIAEQHVRAAGGDPWCAANSMLLGVHCRCHREHTTAARRLPRCAVPAGAIAFAQELLGPGPAELYLERYYASGGPG